MKTKILYVLKQLLCLIGIITLCVYSFDFYSKYIIKQNIRFQTSQYNNVILNSGQWNIAKKTVFTRRFGTILPNETNGFLMYSTSLDSSKNNIKSHFLISLHTPLTSGDHFSDIFLSVFYPDTVDIFDSPPMLYYSIDNEEPIVSKIRYWELKNNILYFYFRPNVYNFFRKCSNAKTIKFIINDFKGKEIYKDFSLEGFSSIYKFAISQLKMHSQ